MIEYDDIKDQLALYEQGRTLRLVRNSPAWEIIVDTLNSYYDGAQEQLTSLPPGDPNVPTAHAAVSALKDLLKRFAEDTNNAIAMANNPPDELLRYLNGVMEQMDVAKATGHEV